MSLYDGFAHADAFVAGLRSRSDEVRMAGEAIREQLAAAARAEFASQRVLVDHLLTLPWYRALRARLRLRSANRWSAP